jgi:hypothetical protein
MITFVVSLVVVRRSLFDFVAVIVFAVVVVVVDDDDDAAIIITTRDRIQPYRFIIVGFLRILYDRICIYRYCMKLDKYSTKDTVKLTLKNIEEYNTSHSNNNKCIFSVSLVVIDISNIEKIEFPGGDLDFYSSNIIKCYKKKSMPCVPLIELILSGFL